MWLMVHYLVLAAAITFLIYIAYHDFMTFQIRNVDVLVLSLLATALILTNDLSKAVPDLLAGVILFSFAFVMWALRMIGAGDAKLYLPLGVIVGFESLPLYLVFLLAFSILMLFALWAARRRDFASGAFGQRLSEIAASKGVPYAVPMAAAAILACLLTLP